MPIYEFECKACGDVREVMQKLSDPQPTECPSCHGGPLVKLMSRTGFILKGGGWYVTDFRDGGKKPSSSSSASSSSATSSAGDSSGGSGSDTGSSSKAENAGGGCAIPSCGPAGCGS